MNGNLYVPEYFGIILNLSRLFTDASIILDHLGVDGYLEIRSDKNKSVAIQKISGAGALRFGTDVSRIIVNLSITIELLAISDVESYGLDKTSYVYELDSTVTSGANEVITSSAATNSTKVLTKMRLFSLSLDEEDEEFTVQISSPTSSRLQFTTTVAASRTNLVESHTLSDTKT